MFEGWDDYFFMLGSSAAALIGLMFVVVTLTAGRNRGELEGGKRLYSSPIVFHLANVMVVSAGAIAPAIGSRFFGVAAGGTALLGIMIGIRNAIGISRARLSGADTHFDIWWYGLVPALVYAGLAAAAFGIFDGRTWGGSAVAAAMMALLLVSIHAEWDLVTYLAPIASTPASRDNSDTQP